MRVNLNVTPPCESPDGCGMALACKSGKCQPCEFDIECATGESCVLDHCVKASNVECHRRSDCGAASVCLLSGHSKGYRGNEDMRARCVALQSGADRLSAATTEPAQSAQRPSGPESELMKAASQARQK